MWVCLCDEGTGGRGRGKRKELLDGAELLQCSEWCLCTGKFTKLAWGRR